MKRKRRTHSPEFKSRIALEAMKGIKPIHEIASENDIHPMQVSQWKKELRERMSEIFERKNARNKDAEEDERRIARLELGILESRLHRPGVLVPGGHGQGLPSPRRHDSIRLLLCPSVLRSTYLHGHRHRR